MQYEIFKGQLSCENSQQHDYQTDFLEFPTVRGNVDDGQVEFFERRLLSPQLDAYLLYSR